MSISMLPAVAAVSRTNGIFLFLHSAPICPIGWIVPHTLDAWLITTASGCVSTFRRKSPISMVPSAPAAIFSTITPDFSNWCSGRITALCSTELTSTLFPGFNNPFSTILRLVVIFGVNTTFLLLFA